MKGIRLFHYISGKSFLHKAPGALKIILMLVLCILAFNTNIWCALSLILALILFSIIFLKFTPSQIITDMIPALIYGSTLIVVSVISNIIKLKTLNSEYTNLLLFILIPEKYYITLFLRITLSMNISSVVYRTTSVSQLTDGFSSIERFFTRKDRTPVADVLSLTITFIPRITMFWFKIDRAWKSRGGTNNVKRILYLTPVLFKVSMQEAYTKAMAKENRM